VRFAGKGGSGLAFDRLITRRDCYVLRDKFICVFSVFNSLMQVFLAALVQDRVHGPIAQSCVKDCLCKERGSDLIPLPRMLQHAAESTPEIIVHELLSDASDLYSELITRAHVICRFQLEQQQQQQQQQLDQQHLHDPSFFFIQEDLDAARRAIATDTVRQSALFHL
jgi:hypothetical protein